MKALILGAAACSAPAPTPITPTFPATCAAIAADLETLRPQFPALVEYRGDTAQKHACWIEYGWHTHRSTGTGGWTSGVPNPDRDGVWFYIGIYDPNGPEASSQINTQPMTPNWWLGDRKVMVLFLAGDDVHGLGEQVMVVLTKHGLVTR
jgi:hypothetical protein